MHVELCQIATRTFLSTTTWSDGNCDVSKNSQYTNLLERKEATGWNHKMFDTNDGRDPVKYRAGRRAVSGANGITT